jgi:hypothetical protein
MLICALTLKELYETLEMHYCTFQVILDLIVVEICWNGYA